jgi:peptidoglycan hydrolase-like protein with peptidoglycan-binding domain
VAWILAESLVRLRDQLNAFAPNRSKASDGTIGDQAHSARISDHNPRWIAGADLVTAFDATHSPQTGLDCHQLRDALIRARDSRVKYMIFDRSIVSGAGGPQPWVRRPYKGPSPHTEHLHLSVVGDHRARDAGPWMLPGLVGANPSTPAPASEPYCRLRDRNDRVMKLQQFMTTTFPSYNLYRPTGFYGLATVEGVKEFQKRTGITGPDANGEIVGPRTLRELGKFGFQP